MTGSLKGSLILAQGKVEGGTTETSPWVAGKPKLPGHGSLSIKALSLYGRKAEFEIKDVLFTHDPFTGK
jgi:hypothetical protein